MQTLGKGRPFEVKISDPGQLHRVNFIAKSRLDLEELGKDEVEIEVEAVGLGIIDSQHVLRVTEQVDVRRECPGIVRRTGSDRSSKLQVGNRVCVLGASLCQSYARTSHDFYALVPDNMTFEQAATLPFRSWLALYLVNEVAGLTKDRSILIHGGEDPTGQLALRFAQEAKTRVYATASSGKFERASQQICNTGKS